jgi:hypothetical protein
MEVKRTMRAGMKAPKRRLNFPVIIFSVSLLFTFVLWDHFFNSRDPVSQKVVSHLVLVMGTLFSAAAGLLAFSLENHRSLLESEVERRTAQLKKRNRTLERALEEIRVLRGFIPICVSCKKIRNDEGFWEQIEEYLQKHTEAVFSHGMCRECMHTHYPEYAARIEKKVS